MELSEIREKIDAVDDQLLDLFLQRMDLSDEVAAYKNAHHLPILNPGPNGIPERPRLLMNLLQHKMGVAAPLCVGEFPSNLFRFFLHRLAVDIIKRSAVCCKCHHVAVVQIGHLAGVF